MGVVLKVAIYVRISEDSEGKSLGVQRQEAECRALVQARGWEVGEVFVDNDKSATTGKVRPAFERLLASQPEAIVCWHTDRLVRLTSELQRVIDLKVNVYAVQSGHLDLSTPAGRAVATTVTAWAQYEGEQKAERQKSAGRQRATPRRLDDGTVVPGRPWWPRRPFGLNLDGTLHADEAAALRACYQGLLEGLSLRRVSMDLAATGLLTNTGRTWSASSLRPVLLNPRNAAIPTYNGEEVGEPGEASWEAIVEPEVFRAVERLLRAPERVSNHSLGGRGKRENLLTGFAVCGKCGATVRAAWRGRKDAEGSYKVYACSGDHCVSMRAEYVDGVVFRRALTRLSEWVGDLPAPEGLLTEEERAELRSTVAALTSKKEELGEMFTEGLIDRAALSAGVKRADERLQDANERLGRSAAQEVDPLLHYDLEDVAEWVSDDPDRWRLLLKRITTEIRVMPRGKGNNSLSMDHVEVDFVD